MLPVQCTRSTWPPGSTEPRTRSASRDDIAGVEIVDHLRKHDQVETARRPFGRHADILQRDVWKCQASHTGAVERFLRNVDRQEACAATGKTCRQHANGAADLEPSVIPRPRQRGERRVVFRLLVGAGFKFPGIAFAGVEVIEIARGDRTLPAAHPATLI